MRIYAFILSVIGLITIAISDGSAAIARSAAPMPAARVSGLGQHPSPSSAAASPAGVSAIHYSTITLPTGTACNVPNVFKCFDEVCQGADKQGRRCQCSSRDKGIVGLKQKALDIQSQATMVLEDQIAKERLGVKAEAVYAEGSSQMSMSDQLLAQMQQDSLADDLSSSTSDTTIQMGAVLYNAGQQHCATLLNTCGADKLLVQATYDRQVASDCDAYESFMTAQVDKATNNLAQATQALHQMRLDLYDILNKYNRGECAVTYTDCVADKGGCGSGFENCADSATLDIKRSSCADVLGQCVAVKDQVVQDFYGMMADRRLQYQKSAEETKRTTCMQQVATCLDDSCQLATSATCATNVTMAYGICPIISECKAILGPAVDTVVKDQLAALQGNFCQQQLQGCFQDQCGKDFSDVKCLSSSQDELAALCPIDKFSACRNYKFTDQMLASISTNMSYSRSSACLNQMMVRVTAICGSDMECITKNIGQVNYKQDAENETARIMKLIASDDLVKFCANNQGGVGAQSKVKMNSPYIQALENYVAARVERVAYANFSKTQQTESAKKSLDAARQACTDLRGGGGIISASFDDGTRLCHTCRNDQICETAGDKNGALKGAVGGATAGAAAGSSFGPWGTAIGGGAGLIGGFFAGKNAAKEQKFCTDLKPCEDLQF